MTRFLTFTFAVTLVSLRCANANAMDLPLPVSEIEREQPVDFATEILPILKQNCLACHHEKEAEGGLILETIAQIRKGGDSGEGVVAGDLDASQIFVRATGQEEPLMPPEDNSVGAKPLNPEQLGLLKLWIEQGAKGEDSASSDMIQWQPIPESIRSVYAMDISADGRLVVVGRGNRVVLFDLQTNQEIGRLVDAELQMGDVADYDLIQSVAAAPDGRRIATGGYRAVRIWKQALRPIDRSTTPLRSAGRHIAVNHDGSAVALVNAIGDIEIWNLAENQKLQTLAGHQAPIIALSWARNGSTLVSGDQSGRLIAWDPLSATRTATAETGAAMIAMAVSADGKLLATVSLDGKVQALRWADDQASFAKVDALAADIADATSVTFAGTDNPLFVVATAAGPIKLISTESNQVVAEIQHGAPVGSLAVTSDQTKLITGGSDGKTKLWNLADRKELVTLEGEAETRLLVARAERDAARQKAEVERLTQQTESLKQALAKEDEVLKKATEEHDKAKAAVEAEEKKRIDAVAVVTETEARIAKATADGNQAKQIMDQATKTLAEATAKSEVMTKEVTAGQTQLTSIEQELEKIQTQLDALTKQKNEAVAKADQARKLIAERQAVLDAATKQAADAKAQIESSKKLAETAAAEAEKATKELEAKQKAVAAAEEAKQKSEAELAKRKQAFDTATSAQARAAAEIPAHQQLIDDETRRQQLLERQLVSARHWFSDPDNAVVSLAISPDDNVVLVAHQDGSVRAYDVATGQPTIDFTTTLSSIPTQVAFAGDTMVALSLNTAPALYHRRPDWVLERTIGSADANSIISDRVTALDFRPDGMSLAVGSGPPSRFGEVKVFAVATGELVRDFGEVHSDTVFGVAFSPDGRQLASAAADKTIRVLDVATGELVRSLEGHTHHVLSLDWQDDGQTIASASADQSIKVWNVETGEQRRTISGFSKEITALVFVQTSNQIVTACADGSLRLSNTGDGKAVRNFSAAGDFLFTVRVSPDGQKVVAAGQTGTVRIWNLADGKLLQEWK
jgi:WD40 repeat protein